MSSYGQAERTLPAKTLSLSRSKGRWSLSPTRRITIFILLFGAEWIPILSWFPPGIVGRTLLGWGILSGSFFLGAGYVKARSSFRAISSELEQTPIGWAFLTGHVCVLVAFLYLSLVLTGSVLRVVPAEVVPPLRYVTGILAAGFAGFAAVPPKLAWRLVRSAGSTGIYALPVGLVAWGLMSLPWVGNLIWNWRPATDLTFQFVRALLHLFLPQVIADRASMTIGSPSFAVTIAAPCAGWEGIALMLVFSVSWLCVRRREYRFPRALLLIPAALAAMWIANAARIAVLILIGVAGAPDVAMNGFHSQAGWIAFNCVALGFAAASGKVLWFTVQTASPPSRKPLAKSSTAAYLLPFLAILAAAMISRAASGGVEWLYPLRLAAGAAVLWFFRAKYAELDWRSGWPALVLGSSALAIWLALDRFSGTHTDNGIVAGLASWPGSVRIAWLACRTAAAVTTVPIAEELAFRGYLIPHLIPGGLQSLHPRRYTYLAVAISSIAFGLLHGNHWLAATIAGLLYAVAFCRRGRIGDAVVAHATTNVLLIAWILWSGNWSSW
jgi:exosortase E/protease (VPEID-CTERM system)